MSKHLKHIIDLLPASEVVGAIDQNIDSLCFDSRQAKPGALFFAIKGTQADGHQYINQVKRAGCSAICVLDTYEVSSDLGLTVIKVKDTSAAMAIVASDFYNHPSKKLKLVAVSELKTEKRTKDKKANRSYFSAKFVDIDNPFVGKTVNIFQIHKDDGKTTDWSGIDYHMAKSMVGQIVEGELVKANVEPYQIGENTFNTTTVVVLKGQSLADVVRQQGKKLSSSQPMVKEILG